MKRWLALAVLAAAGWGCAAGLPAPTSADVARAKERYPDVTAERLAEGRALYVKNCAGCHTLKSPAEVPASEWAKQVDEMRRKQGVRLTDEEASAMVAYLWAVGSRLRQEPGPAAAR